ncbi:MAG TPA: WYL domain-containing protein [Lachnospiraceae bacterium]|nr:WYL domain-containing protein [Lachnospiraceae bacterium]
MAKSPNQKLKILYLKEILYRYTDELHPMSAAEICGILKEWGVEAERKSIYSDVEMLATYGYDIMKLNGRDGGFFMGSREFELPELKLLIDAVMSSKFITKKKSDQLVKKITSFASEYDADELKRQLYSINRMKMQNEDILYSVDVVNTAIRENKTIRFKYCEWTRDIKLKPKKGGVDYEVSPLTLIWDDEYYYLVAFDAGAGIIKHFRVDKMKDVSVTGSRRKKPADKLDMSAYSGKMFGMFGGKMMTVGLECPEDKIGILIDRFGQDIKITDGKGGMLTVHTEAVLSSQFYGWVASVGPEIRLTSPKTAVDGMRDFLSNNLKCY